jgi:hypothetical protein
VIDGRNNDVDVESHQVSGEVGKPPDIALRPSPLDRDVRAVYIAALA